MKCWELEKPEKFTFDFKIKGREVYIEVKTRYNTLTDNQVLQLYESLNEIEGVYIVTNGPAYPGYKPVEQFETLLGAFTLYELDIREHLKSGNRLFHAICNSRWMSSYLATFGPEKYKEKVKEIFDDLLNEELIDLKFTQEREWWMIERPNKD